MIPRALARTAVAGAVATLTWTTPTVAEARTTAGTCPANAKGGTWGAPVWCEEFTDYLKPADWTVYDSRGHAGNGRRSPRQALLGGGALWLHGKADGTTAGIATKRAQVYGRWEARIRLWPGAGSYHPVALLWPQQGGSGVQSKTSEEIDFLEVINDPKRRRPNFFLHTADGQEQAHANVDMTKWHTYAVENTPDGVAGYIDGQEWFRSAKSTRSPMSACLQLDWFPGDGTPGEAWMEVDWLRIYGAPR
ncbi:glycoside hydrolase family 16 protein [Streptosporangium soli]|nr:glycoside hydrolase family 16 protein [Streptosporangium sp. KLBMP 9127]